MLTPIVSSWIRSNKTHFLSFSWNYIKNKQVKLSAYVFVICRKERLENFILTIHCSVMCRIWILGVCRQFLSMEPSDNFLVSLRKWVGGDRTDVSRSTSGQSTSRASLSLPAEITVWIGIWDRATSEILIFLLSHRNFWLSRIFGLILKT